MRKIVVSAAAVLFVLGMSVAWAADKAERSPEDLFKRMDTNSDSKLTLEEFTGKRAGDKADKMKAMFAKIDKNGDGSVSLEEFKATRGKKAK